MSQVLELVSFAQQGLLKKIDNVRMRKSGGTDSFQLRGKRSVLEVFIIIQ